jgi:hypothetical protein
MILAGQTAAFSPAVSLLPLLSVATDGGRWQSASLRGGKHPDRRRWRGAVLRPTPVNLAVSGPASADDHVVNRSLPLHRDDRRPGQDHRWRRLLSGSPASRRAPAAHRISRQPGGRFGGVACGQQDDKPAYQPRSPPGEAGELRARGSETPPGPPGGPSSPPGTGSRGPGRTTSMQSPPPVGRNGRQCRTPSANGRRRPGVSSLAAITKRDCRGRPGVPVRTTS